MGRGPAPALIPHLLVALFILALLSPLLLLLFFVDHWAWPQPSEWLQVVLFTLGQALFSAFLSVFLGLVAGVGLLRFSSKSVASWLDFLVLWPNLVPVLLVILAAMNLVTAWMSFPFGLWAIVGLHVLVNLGLVAVALSRLIPGRLGGLAELAYVEGSSASRFWQVTLWPLMKKDLALLFVLVFSFSFTSFAIPLVVGGLAGTTVEVLIFQKLRSVRTWGEALPLALLQMGVVFALALLVLGRGSGSLKRSTSWAEPIGLWLSPRGLWLFGLVPTAVVLSGLLTGLPQGLRQWRATPEIQGLILPLMGGSLVVGLAVAILVYMSLMALAYLWPNAFLQKFLRGYVAPSTAVTGFAFLIWGSLSEAMVFSKIALGLTLIYFPSLYRWMGESALNPLYGQWQVAHLMGASPGLIFRRIVWPQVAPHFALISGLAAFWAIGDFAFSSIVAPGDLTLAMLVHSLMGAYRLELATLLVWPLLLMGLPFLLWYQILKGKPCL